MVDDRPQDGNGDEHARFDALARRYARLIRSVVQRVAGRQADSLGDDAEQEILLSLWKQVAQEREIVHPVSYIYRAAVRETTRLVRLARRMPVDALVGDGVEAPAADAADAPHAAAETHARIEAALATLAPDRRRAAEAHLAGLTVQQIMDLTGWPYQRARNLIARGVADLRAALRKDP